MSCPATREAVQEADFDMPGDGCPLCGRGADAHESESAASPEAPLHIEPDPEGAPIGSMTGGVVPKHSVDDHCSPKVKGRVIGTGQTVWMHGVEHSWLPRHSDD